MLLKKIILRNTDEFESAIQSWAQRQSIPSEVFDGSNSLFEVAESMIILHADHNISKENHDLRDAFQKKGKETHQIDINATLGAAADSLKFWLENNKPANVLVVGHNKIAGEARLQDYLSEFIKRST